MIRNLPVRNLAAHRRSGSTSDPMSSSPLSTHQPKIRICRGQSPSLGTRLWIASSAQVPCRPTGNAIPPGGRTWYAAIGSWTTHAHMPAPERIRHDAADRFLAGYPEAVADDHGGRRRDFRGRFGCFDGGVCMDTVRHAGWAGRSVPGCGGRASCSRSARGRNRAHPERLADLRSDR